MLHWKAFKASKHTVNIALCTSQQDSVRQRHSLTLQALKAASYSIRMPSSRRKTLATFSWMVKSDAVWRISFKLMQALRNYDRNKSISGSENSMLSRIVPSRSYLGEKYLLDTVWYIVAQGTGSNSRFANVGLPKEVSVKSDPNAFRWPSVPLIAEKLLQNPSQGPDLHRFRSTDSVLLSQQLLPIRFGSF